MDDNIDDEMLVEAINVNSLVSTRRRNDSQIPTEMSDATESDSDQQGKCDINVHCAACHDGRQLMNEIIPIHIDQLFTLLFTCSKFYLDFHASRKTTDLTQTPWAHHPEDGTKRRVVNSTIPLNQTLGPKSAQVTECQIMLPCSKAGNQYAIDVDTTNAGIPYADSFHIEVHHCLKKISETQSSYSVYAQLKFKKSVWELVKGRIERGCWSGLEDFYTSLSKALQIEGDENAPNIKRKSRRTKRRIPIPGVEPPRHFLGASNKLQIASSGVFTSETTTFIVFTLVIQLIVLNVILYYKLRSLEEALPYTDADFHILKDTPILHVEWIKMLQQQETLQLLEIQKWQRIIRTATDLLKKTEEALNEL